MKTHFTFHFTALLILMVLLPLSMQAQKIKVSDGQNQFNVVQADGAALHFSSELSSFSTMAVSTKSGQFAELILQGYNYANEEGAPKLPVMKKLIEIPVGSSYKIIFNNIKSSTIQLSDYEVNTLIIPSQPPVSKSEDAESLPFVINNEIYQTDDWYGQELVRVIELGEMRGVHLARLEIAPFLYNPVTGVLKIVSAMDCEIQFKFGKAATSGNEKARVFSPFYEANFNRLLNYQKPDCDLGDGLIQVVPITYIIVSDPMFEASLQPFIQWKTKKGYKVVEAYTDNPAVGSTTSSIKNYLKSFYQNPPAGYQPQSFVLIVGDVAQVPAFNGNAGSHVTDLYYCEYTNDIFPECFYGRFSATNLSQLQAQIDKTLEYEHYAFPDPSFLDEVVMVAGADASHQLTWGNGQINYGTQYYFNAAHGLLSHNYLQPEPSGGNYSGLIRQNVSDGVAYANYSAHCSPSGWADPSFTTSHISALTNSHRYPLMVGNCCSSVEFQTNCFGEEILRAPLKGAIGYIGGSNSTYWDEDFWWGVGLESISANPTYNSSHLGAYDRTFHDRSGLSTGDWFITQGQMPSAGNLAVTQSGSSLENYYWEIYHLMGDPSLMVYFSQAPEISASYAALMPLSAASFSVQTEPYAYVAISKDGILNGAAVANASGDAEVSLDAITEPGQADVVVTGQNLQPFIGNVMVSTPDGPFISLESFSIDDADGNNDGQADYGETVSLNVSIQNMGNAPGNSLNLTLSSTSAFADINQPHATVAVIVPDQILFLDNAFEFSLTENVPDQENLDFSLTITDGVSTWEYSLPVIAHAPILEFDNYSINDIGGNNNGKLDPGETIGLNVELTNAGSSTAFEVFGELTSSSPYASIITGEALEYGDVAPEGLSGSAFQVYCNESCPAGQNIEFTIEFTAAMGITFQQAFLLVAGQIPVLVVDLDGNGNSAPAIVSTMNNLGVMAETATAIPDEPGLYSSIFVCLGIYSQNHVLNTAEGQKLATYLNNGGNLFMEGGDTWYFDDATAVHPMFGINGTSDGSSDLGTVLGVNGTFTQGMSFNYSGDNGWIDRLTAVNGGTLILNNQSPAYGCGVINQGSNYKTIGLSFELGGLANSSSLMEQFLIYFDLLPSLEANFTADQTEIFAGESVNFTNLSSGNPTAFQWSFPGGTPPNSTAENPVLTYDSPGIFDVSLSVSAGGNTSSFSREQYIVVNSSMQSQSISLSQGWNGISACLIPENTNLFSIFDGHIDDIVLMQNMKGVFYPEQSVNTLGVWDYQSGYVLKANVAFDLEVIGNSPPLYQVSLKAGWNLLPVLSESNIPLEEVFEAVLEKLIVVKSVAGSAVYWPAFNINTIGNLEPGKAYFVNVSEAVTIVFP